MKRKMLHRQFSFEELKEKIDLCNKEIVNYQKQIELFLAGNSEEDVRKRLYEIDHKEKEFRAFWKQNLIERMLGVGNETIANGIKEFERQRSILREFLGKLLDLRVKVKRIEKDKQAYELAVYLKNSEVEEKQRRKAERKEKNSKHDRVKGLAAAHLKKSRQRAAAIKDNLCATNLCPYCFRDMYCEGVADHIYPLAFGGLSTPTNMVRVCLDCNKKKKDMTLREFIVKYSLDRKRIELALLDLKKVF